MLCLQAQMLRVVLMPADQHCPDGLTFELFGQVVAANQSHVPPIGRGSLYLRPLLLGTGPILGLGEHNCVCMMQPTSHHKRVLCSSTPF